MMRSLFSGVAGLKTHQTRMDVIGNNIANVNTTGYKSQSMTFSDIMYQTTQNASGASEKVGGINARQIGLGVKTSAISTAITQQGASQTTNNPFDIMISGDSFFVVNNGQEQLYTRDGTFYVDGAGNLAMQSTGYFVQGWASKLNEEGVYDVDINSGIGKLQVMSEEHSTFPAEATTAGVFTGNIDANDVNITSNAGRVMTLEFYDDRGYLYTAKFAVKQMKDETDPDNKVAVTTSTRTDDGSTKDQKNEPLYTITLMDILDANNVSIGADRLNYTGTGDPLGGVDFGSDYKWKNSATKDLATPITINGTATTAGATIGTSGNLQDLKSSSKSDKAGLGGEYFGMSDSEIDSYGKDATYEVAGNVMTIISHGKTNIISFNPDTGALTTGGSMVMKFNDNPPQGLESFKNISIDGTTLTNVNSNKSSTFKATKGNLEGNKTGRMFGVMNGISVETNGKIWASYSNGQSKLLGQIATASFANASGLEKGGDNLYRRTNNSGDPNIQDITADGGYMNTGVLEMSNVDLSNEFTTMITTQRGFQANSRIITVSDTLLEELTNLKR